jgi:hypothetical protein
VRVPVASHHYRSAHTAATTGAWLKFGLLLLLYYVGSSNFI